MLEKGGDIDRPSKVRGENAPLMPRAVTPWLTAFKAYSITIHLLASCTVNFLAALPRLMPLLGARDVSSQLVKG